MSATNYRIILHCIAIVRTSATRESAIAEMEALLPPNLKPSRKAALSAGHSLDICAAQMLRLIDNYKAGLPTGNYRIDPRLWAAGIIQHRYLSQRLVSCAAFKSSVRLQETIDYLVSTGRLSPVSPALLLRDYGTGQRAYRI